MTVKPEKINKELDTSAVFCEYVTGQKHLKVFHFQNIIFYLYFMAGDILCCFQSIRFSFAIRLGYFCSVCWATVDYIEQK